jgi:hypothetical protein
VRTCLGRQNALLVGVGAGHWNKERDASGEAGGVVSAHSSLLSCKQRAGPTDILQFQPLSGGVPSSWGAPGNPCKLGSSPKVSLFPSASVTLSNHYEHDHSRGKYSKLLLRFAQSATSPSIRQTRLRFRFTRDESEVFDQAIQHMGLVRARR